MPQPFKWPDPEWIKALPPRDRKHARKAFYLSLATLYANDRMSVTEFSRDLGLHYGALSREKAERRQLSPRIAIGIERKLGSELFPWKLFDGE